MSDFVIEPAKVSDAEGILHVQKTAWVCTYPNEEYGISKKDIQEKVDSFEVERWRKNIREMGEKSIIYVAKINDVVIGFSGAMHEENQDRISAVYVLPDNHSRGVGSALMSRALGFLDGTRPIIVGVVLYNEKAIRFYEKFGFKKYRDMPLSEINKRATLPSGAVMPEIEMIKTP